MSTTNHLHDPEFKRTWRRFLLKYLDVNNDGVLSWWEVVIPLFFLILFDLAIELLANYITGAL